MKTKLIVSLIMVCLLSNSVLALQTSRKKESKTVELENNEEKPLYEIFQPGDILTYISNRPTTDGHCRIFKEYNPVTKKYIFIEAGPVIIKHGMSELRLKALAWFWYERLVILRVKNVTAEQKQNALDFCERQIGKLFDHNYHFINKSNNPNDGKENSNQWYCSELVWAAYYNCNNSFPRNLAGLLGEYRYGKGIDIDYNGWTADSEDEEGNKYIFVSPDDIVKDSDVEIVHELWDGKPFIAYFRGR